MTIFDQRNQTAAEYMKQRQDGWFQLERNYSASVQSCRDFNLKMVHVLRSHSDATIDFAEELAIAKTPMEALGAWNSFVERQANAFQKHAGELVEVAQKGANENLQNGR
jgi:hypothetical protein